MNDTSTGVDLAADAIVIADLVADLVAMNCVSVEILFACSYR